MIKQLKLKDYVLIDDLTVNFDNGLNVITGETGAGKSILLNAIDLIFAPRVSKEVIKTGKEKAVLELTLENNHHDLQIFFNENGIDDFGPEIVISKEITQNGVRSRINGTLVNADTISNLRNVFVDIHSQHQSYLYMQQKYHIKLLDEKASYDLTEYNELYTKYQDLLSQLENAKKSATMTESQIDFLKFQIDEIESASIESEKEDEELKEEFDFLNNADKLRELTGQAYWNLNGNEDESVVDALNLIRANISKAASLDPKLNEFEENLTNTIENLKAIGSELHTYNMDLYYDPGALNEIQERIYLLDKLKRKYGGTLENVLATFENLSKELESIEFSTQNIENLEKEIVQIQTKLYEKAKEISNSRKEYSKNLARQIQDKLELLELPKARFEIQIKEKDLSFDGIDEVEFMISTNVSENLKPLAKVASGGEISRVMLAIKSIFADNIDTVIFDEIDTGISGKTSQSVADEIVGLSKEHQIILITHQPIIASKADKHFYIRKSQEDTTRVEVYVLTGDNRINALAELAGGEINQQSMDFAKSLVNS